MKRVIICLALLLGCAFVSVYASYKVERVNREFAARIDELSPAIADRDSARAVPMLLELTDYWQQEENVLMHFFRHHNIDSISIAIARLPALTEQGDFAEAAAELASIRRQMEHVCTSERITLHNLF